jgi:hypothetical protein
MSRPNIKSSCRFAKWTPLFPSRHDKLFFDLSSYFQRFVPAPFELSGDEAVQWIDGIVLLLCAHDLVVRLLQG